MAGLARTDYQSNRRKVNLSQTVFKFFPFPSHQRSQTWKLDQKTIVQAHCFECLFLTPFLKFNN